MSCNSACASTPRHQLPAPQHRSANAHPFGEHTEPRPDHDVPSDSFKVDYFYIINHFHSLHNPASALVQIINTTLPLALPSRTPLPIYTIQPGHTNAHLISPPPGIDINSSTLAIQRVDSLASVPPGVAAFILDDSITTDSQLEYAARAFHLGLMPDPQGRSVTISRWCIENEDSYVQPVLLYGQAEPFTTAQQRLHDLLRTWLANDPRNGGRSIEARKHDSFHAHKLFNPSEGFLQRWDGGRSYEELSSSALKSGAVYGCFSPAELKKIEEYFTWSSTFRKAEHDAEYRLCDLLEVEKATSYEQAVKIEKEMLLCAGMVRERLDMYNDGHEGDERPRVDALLARVKEILKSTAGMRGEQAGGVEERWKAMGIVLPVMSGAVKSKL